MDASIDCYGVRMVCENLLVLVTHVTEGKIQV